MHFHCYICCFLDDGSLTNLDRFLFDGLVVIVFSEKFTGDTFVLMFLLIGVRLNLNRQARGVDRDLVFGDFLSYFQMISVDCLMKREMFSLVFAGLLVDNEDITGTGTLSLSGVVSGDRDFSESSVGAFINENLLFIDHLKFGIVKHSSDPFRLGRAVLVASRDV